MKARWLMGAALAMQMALVSAAAAPAEQRFDVSGGSFKSAVVCAGCVAGGILAVASGGAEMAAVTIAVGGPAAVALAGVISTCLYACYEAFT